METAASPATIATDDASPPNAVVANRAAASAVEAKAKEGPAPFRETQVLAERLRAQVEEAKELARMHSEAKSGAIEKLPKIGMILDAEDDFCQALDSVRAVSPLVLVDGACNVGKSSLLNALLLENDDPNAAQESAPVVGSSGGERSPPIDFAEGRTATAPTDSCGLRTDEAFANEQTSTTGHGIFAAGLPVGTSGGRAGRPLIVRAPMCLHSAHEGLASGGGDSADTDKMRVCPCRRRLLEGRPSLHTGERAEALVREVSEAEWLDRCQQSGGSRGSRCRSWDRTKPNGTGEQVDGERGDAAVGTDSKQEEDSLPPLIFEDPRAAFAWGTSLWLAEVDVEDSALGKSKWIDCCRDVVCLVRASGGGVLASSDVQRIVNHVEAGRRVLVVITHSDVAMEPRLPSPSEVEALALMALSDDGIKDGICGAHAVSLLPASCASSSSADSTEAVDLRASWQRCRASLRRFLSEAEARREEYAKEQVAGVREAFVYWCSVGAKVVVATSEGFKQDSAAVRAARDMITRNIDDMYLAHFFTSVLLGRFGELLRRLETAAPPNLGNLWGRRATRQAMERHLKEALETGLSIAMQESLEEVTAEMARQEAPSLLEIERIARRGTSSAVPWEAEVEKLKVELRPDQLQFFAVHFFGSVSVGVISSLGTLALEAFLGELALGPVGLVAGVATFVAIGVQTADWPSVRKGFLKVVRSKQLELVEKATQQLDFPGLCGRRKCRILERMDVILHCLLGEVAALSEAASDFASNALALQRRKR
eukprot:TRINITY_DN67909_c0_g1_i1.p1 TRINITY_DN67909_c0_g1~~TRINITY_DN67909_c0_g1_i1.p1  ORF type:complete len:769 (+),score=169.58 TRINITY_DN67909_c0_g1_i1:119-2425(+)